jgi:hypothetical protein
MTFALGALAPGAARAYTTDRDVRPPVNYFVLVPPPAGQSYLDPVFGTAIRRVSDAANQPNSAHTGNLAFIVNEYATMSPFNRDNSRLVLQHQSYFAVYDGDGRYLKDLPSDIGPTSEPRWSRHDPNLLYYIPRYGNRNTLNSYDVSTGAQRVVHAFGEYASITGLGESDICFDGDHFVLVGLAGDSREIFVFELSTGRKGAVLDAGGRGFDSVYITPGDQVIVTWLQTGQGPFAGIELYDSEMRFLRQLAPTAGHMDVGRDADGQPVLLWINAADPQAPTGCQNAVVKIRLADAQRTCVLSLGWSMAAHVSASDEGDWFFVSTYATADPAPGSADWRAYTGELLQVRLDGSEVRRLGHHRSRPFNDYWYMPRAAVSRDGRRLVFSSNHGLPSILGLPNAYVDTYVVDVAGTSPAYVGSTTGIRVRYEQDHAFTSYAGSWHQHSSSAHSGGSATLAMDAGSRATFRFAGNSVRWIGRRDRWSGMARVYLDGQLHGMVDTYAPVDEAEAVLLSVGELASGSHALEVEATGGGNPLSAGAWVWLDAFEAAMRAEQDDPSVSYTGGWQTHALDTHSGDAAARASEPGARATFRFSGSAVSWIGYRDERSGIATVYLDGSPRAEIDTYSANPEAQSILYTLSGLPPGEHTLTVEVTGRAHPRASGLSVWVDAFESLPE